MPLDDEEDPEAAAAGEMTLDKVSAGSRAGDHTAFRLVSKPAACRYSTHHIRRGELSLLHQTTRNCSILSESVAHWSLFDRYETV